MQHRNFVAVGLALIGGLVGYSGIWWLLPFAMLSILGWGMASSRRWAFAVILVYYLSACRGLFQGGGVFFAGSEAPSAFSWQWGLFVWVLPPLLLSGVWAGCWGSRGAAWRAVLALVLVSVPPFGFLGFVNPLAGIGVWLPGLGWFGFLVGVVAAGLLARLGASCQKYALLRYDHGIGIVICLLISGWAIAFPATPKTAVPAGWVGVDTAMGKVDGYQALRTVQDATIEAAQRGAKLILLPETVGGSWDLNRSYWASLGDELRAIGVGVLIGAEQPIDRVKRENGLFGAGRLQGMQIVQRVPVPLGMWAPWSSRRHVVDNWRGSGVTEIDGHRVMVLICYEQFLVWPALFSAMHGPDLVLATANLWWASSTSIPDIQAASVRSFARLFNLPTVSARNLSR